MSDRQSKKFIIKLFIIFSFALLSVGCATVTKNRTKIIYNNANGESSENWQYDYSVSYENPWMPEQSITKSFSSEEEVNKFLDPLPIFYRQNRDNPSFLYYDFASPTEQTSVTQDIEATGNSATQTPLPQSVCNMMINGQCNPNTVTAVTAVAAMAVIGGFTTLAVTEANRKAQQRQDQQNNRDAFFNNILTQQGGQQCRTETYYDVSCPCYKTRQVCN